MTETRKVRFGIIGCGGAALPVSEALAGSSVAKLAAVYDLNQDLARDLGARYGVPVAETLDALLENASLQATYLAVPHNQLAPLARQVLSAGKHALVEKPMAINLNEADELIGLADARHLALGVFYELRHAPALIRGRELIQVGAIGDVIGVQIHTLIDKAASYWTLGLAGRWVSSWRGQKAMAGGGVVLMNSSHMLDAVRFMTGLEVTSVSAEVGTFVAPVEVEDTAAATLRYSNGAIGSLFAGAHLAGVNPGGQHSEIYGTLGQLRVPNPYGNEPIHVYLRREWNGLAADQWHVLAQEPANAFAGAVDAFAGAVQRGEPAPTSGRDGRAVLEIVLGLYRAAAEHNVQHFERAESGHA